MTTQPSTTKRRIRRLPDSARREILDAAETLLGQRPFRELSVDDVMTHTGMTRSTFYHYFRSLEDVAIALMRRVQGEMMEAVGDWLRPDYDGDPATGIERGIHTSAEIFARHGQVLAAIHEASFHHEAVEREWRDGVLADWIGAIASRLRVQRERGATHVGDPEEIARALLLMNTTVFVERLGKRPPDPPESVAATLVEIWIGALFPGGAPRPEAVSTPV
jgi:TetR/AcrR family transcriptional regulator, ethionamide resistance regulator